MKLVFKQKNKVNEVAEVVGAIVALGAILLLALAAFYAPLRNLLKRTADKSNEADQRVKEAAKELEPQEQQDFIKKYEAAKAAMQAKAEELKKTKGDATKAAKQTKRPSAEIAEHIRGIIELLETTAQKHPEIEEKFDEAINLFKQVWDDISKLDFYMMIVSKTDQNGLYIKLISKDSNFIKIKDAISNDDRKLFDFAEALGVYIDLQRSEASKMSQKMPTKKSSQTVPPASS